ncbi:hypothetical protein L484_026388 [Morus notabilis]|uniref:Uncharacterized protein n=1 Tax=Morus notabilis TaxID=981085 RepID=W9QXY6_9ROSA|nr:hypothetical protein L484_026388 [Morus notabilis]
MWATIAPSKEALLGPQIFAVNVFWFASFRGCGALLNAYKKSASIRLRVELTFEDTFLFRVNSAESGRKALVEPRKRQTQATVLEEKRTKGYTVVEP